MSPRTPSPVRAAVAALAVLAAAPSAAATPVTFGTNWVAQAEHGGYYQAVADGSYAACGLEVTILPGGPQVNNRALLVAGQIDFYMGGPVGVLAAAAEGIPMVAVAADFQKDPQILMTHPGRVASFDAIAGLSRYYIGNEGFVTFFRWLEAAKGFDPARRVPYAFSPVPFIADPDSAQQGYVTSEPFAVAREGGFEPDVWLLADAGYPAYSQLVVTMRETLERRPEVVRCFVEATAIGWANFLYGDNAPALAAIRAANPDLSEAQLGYSLEALRRHGIVDSGDAATAGIGVMTAARWEAILRTLGPAGVVPADLDWRRAVSLDFAASGAALPVVARLRGR